MPGLASRSARPVLLRRAFNLYFSGNLLAAQFELGGGPAAGNLVYDSKLGFGFEPMVEKEWWVSSDWGLGVAGEAMGLGPRAPGPGS